MYKPLFNHDDEVNTIFETIKTTLEKVGIRPTIDYVNMAINIYFGWDDGMSSYEIDILDWNDDDENDMLEHMFDGNVTVEFYRNDQIIGKFNAVFPLAIVASINSVFGLFQ